MTRAEDYHFVRIFSREGGAVCKLLKDHGIRWENREFKEQTLRECEQMTQSYPAYLCEKQESSVLLSDKARKILRMQAQGKNVAEIAAEMGLSKAGVKYHNQATYRKLGVGSKAEALIETRNRKLI